MSLLVLLLHQILVCNALLSAKKITCKTFKGMQHVQCLVSVVCVWEVKENMSWQKTFCMKYSLPQLGCLVNFEILAAGVQAVIEKKFKTATFDSITH